MGKYDDMDLDVYDPDYGEYEEGTYFVCPREDCQAYDEAMVGNCNAMEPEYIPENGEDCTFYKSEIQQAADEANMELHKRGLKTLKVNPKFRDLVPKMSTEEFKQLEDNILHDGRIREPIVYWNGYIVDGHHRYEIAQKHPEIRYDTVEKKFDSEDEACLWICKNQLGRRNLTDRERDYLIGEQVKMEKKIQGGDHRSEEFQNSKICDFENEGHDTTQRIADENHVSKRTVTNDKKYADAVDKAEEAVPGIGEKIRNGEVKVPKMVMEKIADADPEDQEEAFKALAKGDVETAKRIASPEMAEEDVPEEEPEEPEQYTEEMLFEQLQKVEDAMDSGFEEVIESVGELLTAKSTQEGALKILKSTARDVKKWTDAIKKIQIDETCKAADDEEEEN